MISLEQAIAAVVLMLVTMMVDSVALVMLGALVLCQGPETPKRTARCPMCSRPVEYGDGMDTPPVYCKVCRFGWDSLEAMDKERKSWYVRLVDLIRGVLQDGMGPPMDIKDEDIVFPMAE